MMMKPFSKPLFGLFAGVSLIALSATAMTAMAPAAYAQEEEEEASEEQTLSPAIGQKVQEAYVAGQEEDNPAQAIALLDSLLSSRGGSMTPYERGTVYMLRGQFKFNLSTPDYDGALADFQRALDSNGLTEETNRQLRFNMAQLYFQEERYDEAIRLLTDYINFQQSVGESISANTWYLLAAANVAQENFPAARRPMENALAMERQKNDPSKNYFQLMNFIYSEVGAASERGDLLVEMINIWPNDEEYWSQLSGAYSAAGREEDAAAVLELAYRAGIIDDKNKVLALIRFYTFLDNPIRGAELLEREMAAGNVERSQNNLELLAQAYNQAREQKKALEPLSEAARMAPTGELFYRLGQIYFADEQWQQAIDSLTQAINRGGIEGDQIGDAWLLIGTAEYSIDTNSSAQRQAAINAFRRAQNYRNSSQQARSWITYINDVIRTEERQDRVELLQRQESFNNEKRRCRTNVEIFERIGNTADISEEDVRRCRLILDAEWENNQIVLADGTTVARVEDVE